MKNHLRSALIVLVIAAIGIGAYTILVQTFSRQEAVQNARKATFLVGTIDNALRRLDHLPFVIAQNGAVLRALEQGDGSALNPLLKSFAEQADADHIFLMDVTGHTIAASNYLSEDSFIGKSYAFRPYFSDAIEGKTGRFYAIGATTGQPGYFISAPVYGREGRVAGVVVVKTGLDALNRAWRDSGEKILVANTDSVVVLASDPANLFTTLRPLSAQVMQKLRDARQFGERQLRPLDWQSQGQGRAVLHGVEYLQTTAVSAQEGWTLHLLSSLAGIRQKAALAIAGFLVLLFGSIVAVSSFRSARLRSALRQANADRQRLIREIGVRKATEADLKSTRDELARASRLAALGQLSASITHELGQPISAMRNYLAAEEIAAGAAPNSLNPLLSGLVDRMQNINDQLRGFAMPGSSQTMRFDLRRAADAALELVAHGLKASQAHLAKQYAAAPVMVEASQQQIEQVLINLLRNALDAIEGQARREIAIGVGMAGNEAFVRVTDSGPGLGGRSMAELQEPFATTKPSGQGMGLGLAISAQIAKDMKGRIEARDRPEGGAEFTLWLPQADSDT